jgi:hypothetical protein
MSSQPEITQRDLRMRSKEIMDAVERSFAQGIGACQEDGSRTGNWGYVALRG